MRNWMRQVLALVAGWGCLLILLTVSIVDSAGGQASRLINISTRGRVETGDNVMIGGFIIEGTAPKTVVVRAIGPSLASFGVPGVLADPVMRLFSGQMVIAENNNWQDSQAAAISATGLAPSNPLESAILLTLVPGAYTAIVSGVGGALGSGWSRSSRWEAVK